MNAPLSRHLSAVHPVSAAPVPLAPDVEEALGAAFRAANARVSDLKAVERIASRIPTEGRSAEDLERFFAELLNAAAHLRERGEEVTAEALLIETLATRPR